MAVFCDKMSCQRSCLPRHPHHVAPRARAAGSDGPASDLLQGDGPGVADDVQATAEAVVGVDQSVLIDIHVVDLDAVGRIAFGWRIADEADLLRVVWIGYRISPHATIEEASDDKFF